MSTIRVTVVYALPGAATEIAVRLAEGATVADAIECSGIRARLKDADVDGGPVGIFGKRARRDAVLVDGDRVEIYRPLSIDPTSARHRRAANKRR